MANRSPIIAALFLLLFPILSPAQDQAEKLTLTSIVFRTGEFLPTQYTCEGLNINPPLTVYSIPTRTKSMALIMEDPDAPAGIWVHWLVYNMPPKRLFPENSLPGKPGKTDSSEKGLYAGPCPPAGVHRYYFKLYALDSELEFDHLPIKEELEAAMQGHILARAELIGLYRKSR
jgi:Raf kinase inhibitor-like YbhB/YbcL family protein